MFFWVYDVPNWQLAVLFCVVSILFSCVSIVVARPVVRRKLGPQPASNDIVSYFLSAYGVFYGLMLGLIAVGTYESFADVDGVVAGEAAALAAVYNDASMYPEPIRSTLQERLRDYTRLLIEKVWPDQQEGIVNESAGPLLNQFYRELLTFEPATKAQDHLLSDTLQELNRLLERRRQRINSVSTGLPATLYHVVFIGAMLNVWLCCFFSIDSLRLHLVLVAILAAFIGLVLFLIVAMDNPFRGDFSVAPDPFSNLLNGMMKTGST
jgi:hypothetical protein